MPSLSDHFTYGRLLRFTWPAMLTVLSSSVYGVVDGVFVANLVGKTEFAALNFVWPFVAILGATGFMMGSGGSALVAKMLGEGRADVARTTFSLLTYFTVFLTSALGIVGAFTVRWVAQLLGAEGAMLEQCVLYGRILLLCLPVFALQIYFQSLLVTAERPMIGMWVTLAAGLLNIALDALFIGLWDWGLAGAAWATVLGQCLGAFVPLLYFLYCRRYRQRPLRLGRCRWHGAAVRKACSNGLSEFVVQISISMVSMLYMYQLLRADGEEGVAAYGVMMYFAFVFCAIFIGFGMGITPIIGYHYGARNHDELSNLLRRSLVVVLMLGIAMEVTAQCMARPLCAFFASGDAHQLDYTTRAFRLYSIMFLYTGFNVYASAFFTALNNGLVSAIISLMRTMGFEAMCVLTIPMLFGIDSIWCSVDVGEGLTLLLAAYLVWHYRHRYGYTLRRSCEQEILPAEDVNT